MNQLTGVQKERLEQVQGYKEKKRKNTDKTLAKKRARNFQETRSVIEVSSRKSLAQQEEGLEKTWARDAKLTKEGKQKLGGKGRNSTSKLVTSYPQWLEDLFLCAAKLLVPIYGRFTIENNVFITLFADNILVHEHVKLPKQYQVKVMEDGRINKYIGKAFDRIVEEAGLLSRPNQNAKKWIVQNYSSSLMGENNNDYNIEPHEAITQVMAQLYKDK